MTVIRRCIRWEGIDQVFSRERGREKTMPGRMKEYKQSERCIVIGREEQWKSHAWRTSDEEGEEEEEVR